MDHPSKRRRLAPKMPDPPPGPAPGPSPAPGQHAPQYAPEQLMQLQQQAQHQQQQQQFPPPDVPERHDFESFARHLQDAAMLIYRQTQRSPYSSVSVLLLRWEEDMTVEKDLRELEGVLRDRYNYSTEKWSIPTVPNPSIKLGVQMASFLEHARADHLLIIYYAGHGYVGPDNHLYWACHKGDDAAKLKWDGVRCLFEDAQSDMLLLLDTCAPREAALAGSHGTKQAIAAYTPDRAPRHPPGRSFTSFLAESLAKLAVGRPVSIHRLFEEVNTLQLMDANQRSHVNGSNRPTPPVRETQPVVFTLTPGKGQAISLPVLPSSGGSVAPPAQPESGDPPDAKVKREDQLIGPDDVADLTFDEPRALVCTTFVGDASQDMSFFHQWLRTVPASASKIAVEGMFLGPPTMLLISMPHPVWNVVQHDKVCCFLGHITSHNMTHLYQRLVGSGATAAALAKEAKEAEDNRMLLEAAREAAAGGPAVARQDSRHEVRHEPQPQHHEVRHEPQHHHELRHEPRHELRHESQRETPREPLREPRRELPREPMREARRELRNDSTRHELPPAPTNGGQPLHNTVTPTRPRDGTRHGLPSSAPGSASAAARPAPSASKGASKKDGEVEELAEVKEAAEQLKALSHVRQTSGESHKTRAAGRKDDSGSSPEDSGTEDKSRARSPPSKLKSRRSLQQRHQPQPPAQTQQHPHSTAPLGKFEARCSMCSHVPFKDSSSLRKHIAAAHTRPFPCAFSFAGCTSTFGSKNEWKRHITSQHLCLQYYRCSACPLSAIEGKGNEFNRKDLFTQHLRRMHAPFAIKKAMAKSDGKLQAEWDNNVKDMQQSCLVTRRKPPQRSACPKPGCSSVFEGPGSWDEWTEHVGRHMEKGEGQHIGVDRLLAKWALDEGIIERKEDGEYRLCNQDGPGGGGAGGGSIPLGGSVVSGVVATVASSVGNGTDGHKRNSSNIHASSFTPKAESTAASDSRSETPPPKHPEPDPEDDGQSIVVATTAIPIDDDDRMEVDDD